MGTNNAAVLSGADIGNGDFWTVCDVASTVTTADGLECTGGIGVDSTGGSSAAIVARIAIRVTITDTSTFFLGLKLGWNTDILPAAFYHNSGASAAGVWCSAWAHEITMGTMLELAAQ